MANVRVLNFILTTIKGRTVKTETWSTVTMATSVVTAIINVLAVFVLVSFRITFPDGINGIGLCPSLWLLPILVG